MASNGLDLATASNWVFQKKPPGGPTSQKMGSVASKTAELWPLTFSAIGLEKRTWAFPFYLIFSTWLRKCWDLMFLLTSLLVTFGTTDFKTESENGKIKLKKHQNHSPIKYKYCDFPSSVIRGKLRITRAWLMKIPFPIFLNNRRWQYLLVKTKAKI